MKLIFRNHNEEYAVKEMLTAHIPKIKPDICDEIPADEDYLFTEVSKSGDDFFYNCELRLNDKNFQKSIICTEYSKTHIKRVVNAALVKALKTDLPWGLITGIRPSKIVREMRDNGFSDNSIQKHFLDFYECSPSKTKLAMDVAKNEHKLISTMPSGSISLYIGIPFCPTRCLYCSFTSQSIKFSSKLTEPYMDALIKEIKAVAQIVKNKQLTIDTVYIGGGTPSALNANQIDRLLKEIYHSFDLSKTREFTFEAGRPDTIDIEKLKVINDYGISRISINPQTMNQKTLDIIGRHHTPEDIIKTYELATKLNFDHINTDLIVGLPEENEDDFDHTLREIEKLNPQSVTVHTMSIKRGSYLDEKYSMYTMAAANTVNNMLTMASQSMETMKKIPYYMYRQKNMLGNLENVGYCDKGHECLYNIYIMEEVQSIYALGAGASTKIIDGSRIERIFNVKEVSEYIKRIDEMIARKDILKA